jgi:hypothetical protein
VRFITDEGGAWDVDKVTTHFVPLDVADILRTPVGLAGSTDFLAWNFTKNGVFSVKTAYHLAMQRKKADRGASESSSSCDDHKGWLSLWDAQVPNKIKVHVWRLVMNGLAVGTELSHRKIKDDIVCLACGRTESLVHRFWSCPHSASAWNYLSEFSGCQFPEPPANLGCHADLRGWLLD